FSDRSKRAFLTDFGVSEFFDASNRERLEAMMQESMAASRTLGGPQQGQGLPIKGTKGTMLYVAPELWRGDKSYARPVDMWALGVTLYILLTGRLPFSTLEDIMDPSLPVIPTSYGSQWTELLQGLLNRDPSKRMTVRAARAIIKSMNVEDYTPEENLGQAPTAVTDDDISHALTLAQHKKDQDDVEWLLGQLPDEGRDGPLRRFSRKSVDTEEYAGDYYLPSVMSGSGNTFQFGAAADAARDLDNVNGPGRGSTNVFVRTQTPTSSGEKGNPLRGSGSFSPKEVQSSLEEGGAGPVAVTTTETNVSGPGGNLSGATARVVTRGRFKGKGGFLAVLRDALSFSRCKKSKLRSQ
ncbi:protein kinase, partial [Trypanosoma conorhini]